MVEGQARESGKMSNYLEMLGERQPAWLEQSGWQHLPTLCSALEGHCHPEPSHRTSPGSISRLAKLLLFKSGPENNFTCFKALVR